MTKPFRSWRKTDKLTDHAKREYYLTAMTKMTEFIAQYQQPSAAVDMQMQLAAQKRMADNQQVIESLFKVILLCGKQGFALRGHRDDHISWEEEHESTNEGNFIEIVRFRAENDQIMKKTPPECPPKCPTYIRNDTKRAD